MGETTLHRHAPGNGTAGMRIILAAGTAIVLIAVVAAAFIWTSSPGSASCDQQALESAMRDAIGGAPATARQVSVAVPARCGDADVADALPAVSRGWHPMGGGVLMREAEHTAP